MDLETAKQIISPCTTGKAMCRYCKVDIMPSRSMLCEFCLKEVPCLKCGTFLEQWTPDELCEACYRVTPFSYKLVKTKRSNS